MTGRESASRTLVAFASFCWGFLYFARVFRRPHQNPTPSIAIARTPKGTPTPAPIATFLEDGSLVVFEFAVAVAVMVVVAVAVALAVEFELKLTSVGLRVNCLPSVQQLFDSPQQKVLPEPPGQRMTWYPRLEFPPD